MKNRKKMYIKIILNICLNIKINLLKKCNHNIHCINVSHINVSHQVTTPIYHMNVSHQCITPM